MVLKVAILAEKYATDYKWYVDVILNLIRLAGDYVSEEVCPVVTSLALLSCRHSSHLITAALGLVQGHTDRHQQGRRAGAAQLQAVT